MAVLVVAEHDNESVRQGDSQCRCRRAEAEIRYSCLIAGHEAGAAAKAAAQITGVAKVLHADAPQLRDFLAENVAAVVVSWRRTIRTSSRRPRPTERTSCRASRRCWDVQQISDIVAVEGATPSCVPSTPGTRSPR